MQELSPIIKKLQFKDKGQSVLILNAPEAYENVMESFTGELHTTEKLESYEFVQVFGTSNESLQRAARTAVNVLSEDGLLWLCYPKKSSKKYKGSLCSRDTVAGLLAQEGFEPVRQIAIDEDWSALRFRQVDKIKTMTRDFAVTEKGLDRTKKD